MGTSFSTSWPSLTSSTL